MRLISFDPSLTCTGIWLDPDRSVKLTAPAKLERIQKLGWYAVEIELTVASVSPEVFDLAVVEGYAYNSRRTHAQAEIGGIVRGLLAAAGFPVLEVPPSLWKAHMMGPRLKGAGKRNATERMLYLSIVERTYGKTFLTTDEADAFMMAEYVRRCATEGEVWGTPGVVDFARRVREILRQGRLRDATQDD